MKDGGVQVTVRDTGPGIPADKLDKIFERFYRLAAPESEGGGADWVLPLRRAWLSCMAEGFGFKAGVAKAVSLSSDCRLRRRSLNESRTNLAW